MALPWLEIALVLATGIAMFVLLGALHSTREIHPELLRKLLHVGTGLIALSFPLLFGSGWPVFVVMATAALIVTVIRWSSLCASLGNVLYGVARSSQGEYYFLAAIALLFGLADGDVLLFWVPLMILTFADTAAALVGVRFGHRRLAVVGSSKTIEGSMAFLFVAFVCALAPITLLTRLEGAEIVLISTVLAVSTTVAEAFARKGLDNLLVPLVAFLALNGMT